MSECWRCVHGFGELYEVSDAGNVRNIKTGKPLSKIVHKGYLAASLHESGKRRLRSIHSLVLTAFRGARPDGLVGAHLDGNPTNNKLSNLAWVTPKEAAFGHRTLNSMIFRCRSSEK